MPADRPTVEALTWYEAGLTHGMALGRQQLEDELAAEWAALRAVVMPVALREPFDELAERRGQRDRAERQRQTLRDRGVTA